MQQSIGIRKPVDGDISFAMQWIIMVNKGNIQYSKACVVYFKFSEVPTSSFIFGSSY